MRKYQRVIAVIVIPFWLIVLPYALLNNPGVADSTSRLSSLKSDMEAMRKEGGKIVSAGDTAKYGGAFLTRVVSDEGWSDALLGRYQRVLEHRGWHRMQVTGFVYCKDGMQATLKPNAGVWRGAGTNFIAMTYSAMTIRECGKR